MKIKLRSIPTELFPTGRTFTARTLGEGRLIATYLAKKQVVIEISMAEEIADILDDFIFGNHEDAVRVELKVPPCEYYPAGKKMTFTLLPKAETFGIKIGKNLAVFNLAQLEYIADGFDKFVKSYEESLVAA